MSSEPPKPRVALPTFVRRSLVVLAVVYVVYLIAGNIFLNSSLVWRVVNRRPEAFQAQWDHAQTWWPGYMRASKLRVRGQARTWLWEAHGESASGRVLLWPLLRREIRFSTVDASDVVVTVQPAKTDLKPYPWRADAWWVTAEDIHSESLRKLQWDEVSITGTLGADVGFTHQLRGGVTRILPSEIRSGSATVAYGSRWHSSDAAFHFQFSSDDFTHEHPPGWEKLQVAKLHLVFQGTTPTLNLGIVPDTAQAANAASAVAGRLSTDITLDHGVLSEGGKLQWTGMVATADENGRAQWESADARALVHHDSVEAHLSVPAAAQPHLPATRDHFAVDMSFGSRRILPVRSASETLKLVSGAANVHWHFASLSWLKPLASKKPWLQWDGAGEIDADLHVDQGHLMPGSRLGIPRLDLGASVLGNRFSGVASAEGTVMKGSAGNVSALNMKVRNFVLSPASSPGQTYLRGNALQLDLTSSDDLSRFRDTVLAHLVFTNADVPDLQAYNHYLPGKSLYFVDGHGSLSTDLHMDGEGDVSEGHMQMRTQGAEVALGSSRLKGNLNLDTELAMAKRAGHSFDLRKFCLTMDGVQMAGANDPSWWVTTTLEHGRLDWDRPMQLDGLATMRMKNVSVLLALFAQRKAFPAWIGHLVDDGEADVTTKVHARRGELVLDDLQASNQRVDMLARLRIADGTSAGDIYVRWGVLSLGVALANNQRTFHLANARAWYASQPPLLPASGPPSP